MMTNEIPEDVRRWTALWRQAPDYHRVHDGAVVDLSNPLDHRLFVGKVALCHNLIAAAYPQAFLDLKRRVDP